MDLVPDTTPYQLPHLYRGLEEVDIVTRGFHIRDVQKSRRSTRLVPIKDKESMASPRTPPNLLKQPPSLSVSLRLPLFPPHFFPHLLLSSSAQDKPTLHPGSAILNL